VPAGRRRRTAANARASPLRVAAGAAPAAGRCLAPPPARPAVVQLREPGSSRASAPSSPQEHREKEGRNKNENRIFELKLLQNTMNRNEIQAVSLQSQELIDRKEFRQKIE